ncbi:MAG: hypothetical protein ACEPOZ_02650 [Marinifilaceae bacterium]
MEETKNKESLFKQMFITRTHGFIDISKKRHFWQELANELNGTFRTKHTVSKEFERLILQIPYKQYSIEFEESDTQPLKINCKLGANQKFEFSISYEDSIEKLLKLFGRQDIQVGDEVFDKKYLIQGTDVGLITDLLTKSEIKEILLVNNVFSYNCRYNERNSMLQLSSLVSRTINSRSELFNLYKLFCLTIDQMEIFNLVK